MRLIIYVNYDCLEKNGNHFQLIDLFKELETQYTNLRIIKFYDSLKPFGPQLVYGDHNDPKLLKSNLFLSIGKSKYGYINQLHFNSEYFTCTNKQFLSLCNKSLQNGELEKPNYSYVPLDVIHVPKRSLNIKQKN